MLEEAVRSNLIHNQATERRCVLLVEDDPLSRGLFTSVIKNIDPAIEIQCTATAEEARNRIDKAQSRYYLVIADQYLLGTETGIELWRYCHLLQPDLPFLITSGMKEKMFRSELKGHKCPPIFLGKPFSQTEAREVIQGLIERSIMTNDWGVEDTEDDIELAEYQKMYYKPWKNILFFVIVFLAAAIPTLPEISKQMGDSGVATPTISDPPKEIQNEILNNLISEPPLRSIQPRRPIQFQDLAASEKEPPFCGPAGTQVL